MLIGTVLSWTIPNQLIGLFTTNKETVRIGVTALHRISLGFIISAVSVTCSGVLEGLGKGTPSLAISLARYVVVMIPVAFIPQPDDGSRWSMDCILHYRGDDGCICLPYLSKRSEKDFTGVKNSSKNTLQIREQDI